MLNKATLCVYINKERLENDFAEHMGPQVCLQNLVCLKEEGIAWEGKIDISRVKRIPGLRDKERSSERTGG